MNKDLHYFSSDVKYRFVFDVMVGWWPKTLCQLMAISPEHAPFRPVPAYHIALPEPKDYGSPVLILLSL
ncbi:hypothetical protein CV632_17355 [Geobacillus thermodenitrificans]|nr:hypothetical protein CV632_17355 [Geobacillus thermodenitrificans]